MSVRGLLLLRVIASTGCGGTICGEGTVEQDHLCVAAVDAGAATCCGPGTHADPVLGCVPDDTPRVCDPLCSATDVRDGVVECFVGDGGCGSLPCPSPSVGKVVMCGRMVDAETGARIGPATGTTCDPLDPDPDACPLQIQLHDAVALAAGDPSELAVGELIIDDCGAFVAIDVDEPASGVIAIVVDDVTTDPPQDEHAATAIIRPASAGLREPRLTAYATRHATDQQWTSTAGDPFAGQTFAQVGTQLLVFRWGDEPVESVTVGNGQVFYFADNDPGVRSAVDPDLGSTGVNGAALRVGSAVGASASGGEPVGCEWLPLPFGTIPGLVIVEDVYATTIGIDEACL